MKKLSLLLVISALLATPVIAKGVSATETDVVPNQETTNTKSYTGINYNRQDSEQVGLQKIVNDHSWFNINVNIIKKGALFKKGDVVVGKEEK